MDVRCRLDAEGVALRLEGVDRRSAASGEVIDALQEWRLSGLSPHPASVVEGICESGAYEGQMRDLALRGASSTEGVRQVLTHDVRWACDALRPAYDRAHIGSGCATLPVPPWMAESRDLLLAEARALHWEVDRPNLVLGLTTGAGTAAAVEDLLAEGIGVQLSNTASATDMAEVAESLLTGLERARAAGRELAGIRCVVSVPLMLLGEAITRALPPGSSGVQETAGDYLLACARFLYHEFESRMEGPRWSSLVADGIRPWELSWSVAGTGADGRFVGGPERGGSGASLMVGWGTSVGSDVRGLSAFLGDGISVPENLSGEVASARATARRARSLGVDLTHIAKDLTRSQGRAGNASWLLLRTAVSAALDRHREDEGVPVGGGGS